MSHLILPFQLWTDKVKKHRELISPVADAFLKRREIGKTHPVHDFLFTYYSCSPGRLKQWIPSFEQRLELDPSYSETYPWLNDYWFKKDQNVLSLNPSMLHVHMKSLAQFISEMCGNVLARPPRFGCFGLHEWAMVYKLSTDDVRHKGHTLRLAPRELADFVESQNLCCSHYDAYRFFTPEAKPLNSLNPLLDTRLQMEQGGCVHANMDLYKWSLKLWPWIGSDFLAKTFFLALEGREMDMRASPYDLSKDGFDPICIETEEGRRQYQKEQQQLTDKATPLRRELKELCDRLLEVKER